MIVAGQTENLQISYLQCLSVTRSVQVLNVPWQDFVGIGSSVPLVLKKKKKHGSKSPGCPKKKKRPIAHYGRYYIRERFAWNCHSKVCVRYKGLRCVDDVCGCRCFAILFLT